jgi:putative oxidoreductase
MFESLSGSMRQGWVGRSTRLASSLHEEATREEIGMDQARAVTHFLLRVVSGLLFVQHGGQKLFGWLGGIPPNGGPAPLLSMAGVGGLIEFVGGIAILLGLFTRPVAFVLAGEMAVAYFLYHQPGGLSPILNQGEPAVLYCFIYLFFAAHGAGEFSLDAFRERGGGSAPARSAAA